MYASIISRLSSIFLADAKFGRRLDFFPYGAIKCVSSGEASICARIQSLHRHIEEHEQTKLADLSQLAQLSIFYSEDIGALKVKFAS